MSAQHIKTELPPEVVRAIEEMSRRGEQAGILPNGSAVFITPSPVEGCKHEWPEDDTGQTDQDGCCTKCGISFMRYVFSECP